MRLTVSPLFERLGVCQHVRQTRGAGRGGRICSSLAETINAEPAFGMHMRALRRIHLKAYVLARVRPWKKAGHSSIKTVRCLLSVVLTCLFKREVRNSEAMLICWKLWVTL